MKTVDIHTEAIRLQDFLKLSGAVQTGGQAKLSIQNGETAVNGETCLQRGKKLRSGDIVSFHGQEYRVERTE